ncbi:hypothetical protein CARUB_v10022371mg, partial [Capsella rubella]
KKSRKSSNNVDRISELPEALIQKILCLLPTKAAIATSVLSKQWRSHWKLMPELKFDALDHELDIESINKSLFAHKALVLQRLHLKLRLTGRSELTVDFGILIGIALTRNVRELVLKVHSSRGLFKFPKILYDCEKLETLKLMLRLVLDVPSTVSLRSLRTLHLEGVDFKDEDSVLNLLSGCPKLQDLVVCREASRNVSTFRIVVPSLQRLTIHNGDGGSYHQCCFVINTPSLKFLKIEGTNTFESSLIVNLPELMEVNITNVDEISDEKLLMVLSSVKRLSMALSPLKFKFPIGIIFEHLVYLELYTYKKAWWDLLPLLLHSSPKLQVLKLIDDIGWKHNDGGIGEWNQPENVPECLLSHLETFMWKGYKWKQEREREVAKYILKHTDHLKRVIFSSKDISYRDRLKVVNDLKSVVRDTNSCKFQYI